MMNQRPRPTRFEAAILAGGLSRRMGKDKARLRLGRRTLLGHVRAAALALGIPVRVIRRDLVPRCGPLGGIYTALSGRSDVAILFLSCDMPLVTPQLLLKLAARLGPRTRAVFTSQAGRVGFPFVIRGDSLPRVAEQIAAREFSLQMLARKLKASRFRPGRQEINQLANVNTPEELENARKGVRAAPQKPSDVAISRRVNAISRRENLVSRREK